MTVPLGRWMPSSLVTASGDVVADGGDGVGVPGSA
ncbi:hypothetical protein J3R03_003070 [Actinoplanes couchii]|nr:hypothetical protein [Actinoplanes couchii]